MHPRYLVRTITPATTTTDSVRKKRSVVFQDALWEQASTITVAFTHTVPDELAFRIEAIIRRWDPHHNLALDFVQGHTADIRIYLGGVHNNSFLGSEALAAEQDEPTLCIAVLPEDPMFEATLLHEFGHALGLDHEHLHPDANIPWNKERVYDYYKQVAGWDKGEVDRFMFEAPKHPDLFLGTYDKFSIMHYDVPDFLTDGHWQLARNLKISEQDKVNMRTIYPPL
ncbi:peptidase M12 [Pseudomonas sp. N40(2020)]|uniref:M12 family metallopeptidase n=1 Tax=Pseudomonas sp. N40(2020) TaxID=2767798 RepID=UPI001656BC9D|nr:M12 family metallopeptidase [Pseudomonas sp. N40(2020)]MBC8997813.1 peptidase M12 [Pseudomonas sp. N40(2020)]